MLTSEIPNLNKVYEDETVEVWIHDVNGEGKLFVLHTIVIQSRNLKLLKHYLNIVSSIYSKLAEKGLEELEAWCITDTEVRYAEFFGFEYEGMLTANGRLTTPVVHRLKRKLK